MNNPGRNWRESKKSLAEKHRKDVRTDCKKALDEALDLGLDETFPASDAVAVTQPVRGACDKDRQ
jgi:hypothetical protein